MFPRLPIALTALLLILVTHTVSGDPKAAPQLVLTATYDTGLGASGAEIISVRHAGIAALTNIAGSVDILDLSNPLASQLLLRRVPIAPAAGTPNSVALHPFHDYFLVASGGSGQIGQVAAYRVSDGAPLDSTAVGIQPDSIAISPNGRYAVVANEAEATAQGQNGGPGSLSVLDLTGFDARGGSELAVSNLVLPSLAGVVGASTGRTDDIGRLAIDNTPNTLEPESVAFSPNSRYAYVTLQENNIVLRLDLQAGELTAFGVGQVSHVADTVVDGSYTPATTLTTFREPDGIALDQTGRYFVTANEGDSRNGSGRSGVRGGRTVSLFDARTGELLGDTGAQLDAAAAGAGAYDDNRSNRGGSEPEVLDLAQHRGVTLVAVGLERANSVALIDTSDPTTPTLVDIAAVGAAPEGIKFFRVGQQLFVASANEVSGTVSILEVVF